MNLKPQCVRDAEADRIFRDRLDAVVHGVHVYPEDAYAGKGIVTAAGGPDYFVCAWVLIRLLRALGCNLPIELWYLGPKEMSSRMESLLAPYDVRCIDGLSCIREDSKTAPEETSLTGWMLKVYAILRSHFREILWLDADNVPAFDPSWVFKSEYYEDVGAIFWPDRWWRHNDDPGTRLLDARAWEVCGLSYREEPELEAGQFVLDKARVWSALQVAWFLNRNADYYYQNGFHGDKDTFHLAWHLVNSDYAMPPFRPVWWPVPDIVLYQHDFEGRIAFQHRTCKWRLTSNLRFPGMQHERACLRFIDELRAVWTGEVRETVAEMSLGERRAFRYFVCQRWFHLHQEGHERRLVELRPDRSVGAGDGPPLAMWLLEPHAEDTRLRLRFSDGDSLRFRSGQSLDWVAEDPALRRAVAVLSPVVER